MSQIMDVDVVRELGSLVVKVMPGGCIEHYLRNQLGVMTRTGHSV